MVATHQVSHLEFESFGFSFDQPAAVFSDQKSGLLEEVGDTAVAWEGNGDGDLQALELPDLHRFFSLFEDGVLARDIFTAVEDCRLDHRVLSEYRGIREAYKRVQDQSLSERPAVEEMRARESMVELLIRFSLQQGDDLAVPERYSEWAKVLWEIVQPLSQTRASVEDSAEATIRLYDLISQIPNEEINEGDWDVLNTNEFQDEQSESESEAEWGDDKMDEIMKRLMELQPPDPDAEGQSYQSPSPGGLPRRLQAGVDAAHISDKRRPEGEGRQGRVHDPGGDGAASGGPQPAVHYGRVGRDRAGRHVRPRHGCGDWLQGLSRGSS